MQVQISEASAAKEGSQPASVASIVPMDRASSQWVNWECCMRIYLSSDIKKTRLRGLMFGYGGIAVLRY